MIKYCPQKPGLHGLISSHYCFFSIQGLGLILLNWSHWFLFHFNSTINLRKLVKSRQLTPNRRFKLPLNFKNISLKFNFQYILLPRIWRGVRVYNLTHVLHVKHVCKVNPQMLPPKPWGFKTPPSSTPIKPVPETSLWQAGVSLCDRLLGSQDKAQRS